MIEPSELRTGNLVYVKGHRSYFRVTDLNSALIGVAGGPHFKATKQELEPIPLDDQWLLKFGFMPDKGSYDQETFEEMEFRHYIKGRISVGFEEELVAVDIYDDDITNGLDDAKGFAVTLFSQQKYHIHQLQNLFFSLTGQELTEKSL